jgi:hypothetical protein
MLGERYERKNLILLAGTSYAAAFLLPLVVHLGTFLGPLLISNLFTWTAANGYYGWIFWVALPCALLPSLLIGRFGMNQRSAVLEQIST